MDDKKIVELFFARQESAIAASSGKFGAYLYSIAYNVLGNREDAEECVNDTYIDAWNCIPPHRPSNLSAFLGKITRRISIDKLRKRKAKKRGNGESDIILEELHGCIISEDSTEHIFEAKELSQIINSFIKTLPQTERNIFICRYWYMESISDICIRFGFSESKIKSILHRSREKLRKKLKKEGYTIT